MAMDGNGNSRSTQILLVEDDADQATLVKIMLEEGLGESHGFTRVERLADAKDALVAKDVTCVLLDLSLPDARGLAGLMELREMAPGVPIVVLTARTEELLALRAVQEGAQDYLVKGKVDSESLGRSVRYAIARKQTEVESLQDAMHDPTTGLPNRSLLLDRLMQVLARSRRQFSPFAVLFLDLDGFKQINDNHGHAAGDLVLQQVAHRIREAIREMDTPARYGGDEFVVLCEQVTSEDEAAEIAERITAKVTEPLAIDGNDLTVGLSIGIAVVPPNRRIDAAALIQEADDAMYEAKSAGAAYRLGSA
jgi:diguanylate cyclase (GGDEF)-like protein